MGTWMRWVWSRGKPGLLVAKSLRLESRRAVTGQLHDFRLQCLDKPLRPYSISIKNRPTTFSCDSCIYCIQEPFTICSDVEMLHIASTIFLHSASTLHGDVNNNWRSGITSLIEEAITERITRAIRFCARVLDHVGRMGATDPRGRNHPRVRPHLDRGLIRPEP